MKALCMGCLSLRADLGDDILASVHAPERTIYANDALAFPARVETKHRASSCASCGSHIFGVVEDHVAETVTRYPRDTE